MLDNQSVKFYFQNINLPDSNSNEKKSHGFVQYKIKRNPSIAKGTVINNKAHIIFDYNAPIITNTASTLLENRKKVIVNGFYQETVSTDILYIYPNPSSDYINIEFEAASNFVSVTLFDLFGKQIETRLVKGLNNIQFSKESLPAGIYILQVTKSNGQSVNTKIVWE
ncbi:MAG: T9SS type A sorting domain-containing protein [Bacteroidetes bacterium]|nr:T9SS type A sorting domain-containing protein [Bacteroidota bacterium]